MRDFLQSVEGPDVVESVDRRTEASMKAKYLAVDEYCQGKVVEQVLRGEKYQCFNA